MRLTDFNVSSVTGGIDALGDVVVQLESAGIKVSGRGLSTDVVEATARAYLAAANRIVRARASATRRQRSARDRVRRASKAGVVTALVGLSLAACSSSPPRAGTPATKAGRPFLSSKQAAAIVGRTASTNNKANSTLDLPLLHSYESGSAYAIDGAQYTMSKLAKKLGTKPAPFEPFSVRPLQVVVGGGRKYPLGFLAVGTTSLEGAGKATGSCPHGDTLLEYEKSSAASPWRIILEPAANQGDFAQLASEDGVAAPLSAAEDAAADKVPQRVATALQSYEVSGRLGPFSSVDFNGPCWSIPYPRKELLQIEASGVSGRELYRRAGGTVSYLIGAGASSATGAAASTS